MKTPNQHLDPTPARCEERQIRLSHSAFFGKLFSRRARIALAIVGGSAFALACSSSTNEPGDSPGAAGSGGAAAQSGSAQLAGSTATPQGGGGVAGGTGGGVAGGVAGGGAIPPDPACLADVLNRTGCLGCHYTAAVGIPVVSGGLDLTGTNLGARLSNMAALYAPGAVPDADLAKCEAGAKIIQPGNPARSVLLLKVKGQQTCGLSMPVGSTGLSGADLQCIESWVMSFQ